MKNTDQKGDCWCCRGRGRVSGLECEPCNGTGTRRLPKPSADEMPDPYFEELRAELDSRRATSTRRTTTAEDDPVGCPPNAAIDALFDKEGAA